jgi:hypothetical protein
MVLSWQPFNFTTDPARFQDADADQSDEHIALFGLRRMSWAPFVDYYWGSRYQALDQFLWRTLSFAPLGVLVALAFGRWERRGGFVAVLSGLVLAAVVECGKYFIPERHPSTTSLLIQTAAVWLGYIVARHVAHVLAPISTAQTETTTRPGADGPAPFWDRLTSDKDGRQASASSRLALADSARDKRGRNSALLQWFDTQPYWVQIALIGVAGVAVPVGLVMLLRVLGVF